MISIEIDRETFGVLQSMAEPFVDTPQTVLRRLLGLAPPTEAQRQELRPENRKRRPRGERKPKGRRPRAPLGVLLPEREYELPILRYLLEHGGQAPSREVVDAVGGKLSDRLTDADRETLSMGGVRWESRVHFTRLRLAERGLMRRDTARGVWALTQSGMDAARKGGCRSDEGNRSDGA